ncbi:MAG: hypothetical protein AMXMBFR13_30660 [Phycisphaerae bacterium]
MPSASTEVPRLLSAGVIAERLAIPVHVVLYMLRSRAVAPIARAGNTLVYGEDVVSMLRGELERNGRRS